MVAVFELRHSWFNDYCDIISNKAHLLKAIGISALFNCKYFTIMGSSLFNEFNISSLLSYNFIPFKIPLAHNIGALL